jgi:hypothetical protein
MGGFEFLVHETVVSTADRLLYYEEFYKRPFNLYLVCVQKGVIGASKLVVNPANLA